MVEDSNMPPSFSWHMNKKGVFRRLDSTERLVVRERGVIIGSWDIAICRDYRGLAGYKQNQLCVETRVQVAEPVQERSRAAIGRAMSAETARLTAYRCLTIPDPGFP